MHFDAVVEGWVIQHLHYGTVGSGFGVFRAVDDTLEPGMYHGSGTHRARLNRNKQRAVTEAVVANSRTGFAEHKNFGVSGGVVIEDAAVVAASNDLGVANNDRADRNFPRFKSTLGGAEGFLNVEFVGHDYASGCCCVMQCMAPKPQMKSPL